MRGFSWRRAWHAGRQGTPVLRRTPADGCSWCSVVTPSTPCGYANGRATANGACARASPATRLVQIVLAYWGSPDFLSHPMLFAGVAGGCVGALEPIRGCPPARVPALVLTPGCLCTRAVDRERASDPARTPGALANPAAGRQLAPHPPALSPKGQGGEAREAEPAID